MKPIERWFQRSQPEPQPATAEFIVACAVGDLAIGEIRRVEGFPIAICRTAVFGFHAFSDCCPHKGLSLAEGALRGEVVHCPFHGGAFDVRNGKAVAGPTRRRLEIHHVLVRDGQVLISPRPAVAAM
jgi:carbazole 1,9a-dioxygenase ferredoxin component